MSEFKPEYPGDTPNRQWVRRMCKDNSVQVDYPAVVLRASDHYVRWAFDRIIAAEWPGRTTS